MANASMDDNQSLDSIIESIKQHSSLGVNISPYLSAIQSLNGNDPSEKYKHLNTIVKKIIAETQNIDVAFKCIDESEDIPSALKPLVKIHVASELKAYNIILEALISEDKTIVNQALKAKWFYDNSNPILQADYFVKNVLPHLPDLVRYKLLKILSKTLNGAEKNAENLFNTIVNLHNFKEALPLLPACSEDFIFNEIMTRKLVLSHEMLLILYKKYPKLVIRYLNLGNSKNDSNEEDRKLHKINICKHKKFIPHLIRNDVYHFIELRNVCGCKLSIGKTRTALFFKQAADAVVNDPKAFLKVWPISVIINKLTTEQYEKMFGNLFPEEEAHFQLHEIIAYLKYYPKEKRLDLLNNSYKLKYTKELLDGIKHVDKKDLDIVYSTMPIEFFEELFVKALPLNLQSFSTFQMLDYLREYPKEKKLKFFIKTFKIKYSKDFVDCLDRMKSEEFLKLLPIDEREKQVKKLIDLCQKKDDEYYKWYVYMPFEKSFPIFKDAISESSLWNTRCEFFKKMLKCCESSGRKEDLLQVFKYYVQRHKNERIEFLTSILEYFQIVFNLKNIDREVWDVLYEIIQAAHVKGELSKNMFSTLAKYINAATYIILADCKGNYEDGINESDQKFLNNIFDITADFIIDTAVEDKISDLYEFSIERYSLDKLVNLLAMKYPSENLLWQGRKGMIKKFNITEGILRAFHAYNKQCIEKLKKASDCVEDLKLLKILDYLWLFEFTKELVNLDATNDKKWSSKLHNFKQLLKQTDPEMYKTVTSSESKDRSMEFVNIRSGAAWTKLKKNYHHVLDNWIEYFTECRNRLQKNSKFGGSAAKRFLLTLKWYEDLPGKFIERAFLEIKEVGSMKMLGVLIESEVFSRIIASLAPQASSLNISNVDSKSYYKMVRNVPQSMNLTNPLVPLDTILLFCEGDYLKLAIEAFTYVSQRISKSKILIFAESLIKKPVAVKKQGIKLFFKAATKVQLEHFVRKTWAQKSHTSIREIVAEMVKDRHDNNPNEDTWKLLEICLEGLNRYDEIPIKLFCESPIQDKYASLYIDLILQKIETLYGDKLPELRKKYLCLLFENIKNSTINNLTDGQALKILEKYFFEAESEAIFKAARSFALRMF